MTRLSPRPNLARLLWILVFPLLLSPVEALGEDQEPPTTRFLKFRNTGTNHMIVRVYRRPPLSFDTNQDINGTNPLFGGAPGLLQAQGGTRLAILFPGSTWHIPYEFDDDVPIALVGFSFGEDRLLQCLGTTPSVAVNNGPIRVKFTGGSEERLPGCWLNPRTLVNPVGTTGTSPSEYEIRVTNVIETDSIPTAVIGADAGGSPHVRARTKTGASPPYWPNGILAYGAGFSGGVRVGLGDIDGDGIVDIITAPGPGGSPHVKVFSGRNGNLIRSFLAYGAGFAGGVFVASGDTNGDGWDDIITSPGAGGGPHVKVFSGRTGSISYPGDLLMSFNAYAPGFSGGVHVASGDVNGDTRDDVITGPGAGGGPHVKVFSGFSGAVIQSFLAYPAGFTGGVYVAAGYLTNHYSYFEFDEFADIITGPGAGGGPHVKVFSGGTLEAEFLAFSPTFTGGVRVGVASVLGADGIAGTRIVAATGPGAVGVSGVGTIGTAVRLFDRFGEALSTELPCSSTDSSCSTPYGAFSGGAFVGGKP